jgi:RNA polymerase sigma factor (sigma-70 family)
MITATASRSRRDSRQQAGWIGQGGRITQIVRGAAAGERDAWEALVLEFGDLVRGVARAHRLREADVADVAQTTWLRLVEHLGRMHDPERVGAWLATTACRESMRVLRRASRQIVTDQLPESSIDDDLAQHLVTAERDEALRKAFGRLCASDQALLGLLVSDRAPSYVQIGRILHMPVGSIGPTRARSLGRLRREAALVGLTAERVEAA